MSFDRIAPYIAAGCFLTILVLFLLSVFGPMRSDKPFWRWIRRVRNVMDAVSYWFLTACLVVSAVVAAACLLGML